MYQWFVNGVRKILQVADLTVNSQDLHLKTWPNASCIHVLVPILREICIRHTDSALLGPAAKERTSPFALHSDVKGAQHDTIHSILDGTAKLEAS